MPITANKRLSSILATEFMSMYDHAKSRFYIDKNEKKNRVIRKENGERKKKGLEEMPLMVTPIHTEERPGMEQSRLRSGDQRPQVPRPDRFLRHSAGAVRSIRRRPPCPW